MLSSRAVLVANNERLLAEDGQCLAAVSRFLFYKHCFRCGNYRVGRGGWQRNAMINALLQAAANQSLASSCKQGRFAKPAYESGSRHSRTGLSGRPVNARAPSAAKAT